MVWDFKEFDSNGVQDCLIIGEPNGACVHDMFKHGG